MRHALATAMTALHAFQSALDNPSSGAGETLLSITLAKRKKKKKKQEFPRSKPSFSSL